MAKSKTIIVKLVSTAGTGYFKIFTRNPKTCPEPLSFRKFDPRIRKHVKFVEQKNK